MSIERKHYSNEAVLPRRRPFMEQYVTESITIHCSFRRRKRRPFGSSVHYKNRSADPAADNGCFDPSDIVLSSPSAPKSMEMSENPQCHVYTNPNYPHISIGGLPFYLMPASKDSADMISDTALRSPVRPRLDSPRFDQRSSDGHFYEPGGSDHHPIYEDIDKVPSSAKAPDERTYYNVPIDAIKPSSSTGHASPASSTQTSSSEVSIEAHHATLDPRLFHVSPQRVPNFPMHRTAKPKPANAMYYYSDTLRNRQNPKPRPMDHPAEHSDSGFSHVTSNESSPLPLSSSRYDRSFSSSGHSSFSPARSGPSSPPTQGQVNYGAAVETELALKHPRPKGGVAKL